MNYVSVIQKVESGLHWVIYAMVVYLFGAEIYHMINSRSITIESVLTFFIYLEIMQMIAIFFQTGKIPIRYPLYISMFSLARHISFENLGGIDALAMTGSIALLSLALVGLSFRNKLSGDKEPEI